MVKKVIMEDKKVQVTQQGYDELAAELMELTEEKRPSVVSRLERARQEGDLKENSDYTSAREELDFLDGRIDELKHVIDNAEIIKNASKGAVGVGNCVVVQINGDTHEYNIVGEWEADPMEKKISNESPLGKQLVGKKVGEEIEVDAPAGKIVYKILEIK